MSKQSLMAGVTAVLLIGAGGAFAQTQTDQGQSGAQGQVQQTAPAQQGTGAQTGAQTGAETGADVQQGQAQTGTEAQTDTQTGTQTQQGQTQTEAETGAEAGTQAEQEADTQQQTQEQTQQQTQETTVDVDITAEQETRIESEISEIDVEPIEVDFDVAVGVSVPGTIILHPLPVVIVDVVPDFAGFLFFVLLDGRIAIVHPDTHVIVAVV